ncbi:MAG: GNAT family N-acetyltransferase [Oscillospiraceae bacterium]|nr:GNAT family N-acetyltransferase [Oscillospiraceae bacterium]
MIPEDADGKAYVHYTSCLETYTGLMDPEFLAASTLDKYHAIALRFVDTTLIAELDGRIVGFGCWDPKGGIPALYLLRDAQGYGIGRRLLEAMLERLSDCKQVRLEVLEGNDRAIGFYEHMGFRLDGTRYLARFSAVHPVLGMVRAV